MPANPHDLALSTSIASTTLSSEFGLISEPAFRNAAAEPTAPCHDEAQGTILKQYTGAIPTTTPLPVFPPLHRYATRAFTQTYDGGLPDGADVGVGVGTDTIHTAGERLGARFGMPMGTRIGLIIGGLAGLVVTVLSVVLCCQCSKRNR